MRISVPLVPAAGLALALTGVMSPAASAGTPATGARPAGTISTSWKVQATPKLPSGISGDLNGLSCATASNCWAVGVKGTYLGVNGPRTALAEHWNGTEWALHAIPSPASQTELDAVSCLSATDCETVGSAEKSGTISRPLAEHWNGTAWSVQTSPGPGSYGRYLTGLSCVSATDCVAVGVSSAKQGYAPWADHWNGTAWAALPALKSVGTYSELTAVSCTSATWCLAVGEASGPIAESWNGTAWTMRKPVNPSGRFGNELAGVTCSSATSCLAVGDDTTSATAGAALAEHWNGSAWTVQNTHVTGPGPYLGAVSCPAATNCTAMGSQDEPGNAPSQTLAEHWNGTSWTEQSTPKVSRGFLQSVSCTTTRCLAVGEAGGDGTTGNPLAETN